MTIWWDLYNNQIHRPLTKEKWDTGDDYLSINLGLDSDGGVILLLGRPIFRSNQ